MGNLKSHKLVFSGAQLYFICLLAISLSPLALRWAETAAHIEIFRDSTGQPSDLSEDLAPHVSRSVELSSDANRGKTSGIRPDNRNGKSMTTVGLQDSSRAPIVSRIAQ